MHHGRPGWITFLAVCQFLGGALTTLVSLFFLAGGAMAEQGGAFLVACGLFTLLIGVLHFACFHGLWTLRGYGRRLMIGMGVLGLLNLPIGTIVSIFILKYLFSPDIKDLFTDGPTRGGVPTGNRGLVMGMAGLAVALVLVLGAAMAVPDFVGALQPTSDDAADFATFDEAASATFEESWTESNGAAATAAASTTTTTMTTTAQPAADARQQLFLEMAEWRLEVEGSEVVARGELFNASTTPSSDLAVVATFVDEAGNDLAVAEGIIPAMQPGTSTEWNARTKLDPRMYTARIAFRGADGTAVDVQDYTHSD